MKTNKFYTPFDEEFTRKLKMYYSDDNSVRRTGRSIITARVLLELALDTCKGICLTDHYDIFDGTRRTELISREYIRESVREFQKEGVNIILNFFNGGRCFTAQFKDEESYKKYLKIRLNDQFIPTKEIPSENLIKLLLLC